MDHVRNSLADRPHIELKYTGESAGIDDRDYVRAFLGFTLTNTGREPAQILSVMVAIDHVPDDRGRRQPIRALMASASDTTFPYQHGREPEWLAGPGLPFELSAFQTQSFSVDISFVDPAPDCDGQFPIEVRTGHGQVIKGVLSMRNNWIEDARERSEARRRGTMRKVHIPENARVSIMRLDPSTEVEVLPDAPSGEDGTAPKRPNGAT